jgi:hypothetical protein
MKTKLIIKAILLIGMTSLYSFRCSPSADPSDDTGPEITIVSPQENATFYTETGVDTPSFIIANATAIDDSDIKMAYVRVFNSDNIEVYYHSELAALTGMPNVGEIYTSFSTDQPGIYTIHFIFEDINDNESVVVREVTCLLSEGGDEPG